MKTSIESNSERILDQTIRSTFGKLNESEIIAIAGDRELLLLKLMELYGFTTAEAQDRVYEMKQRTLQSV